ncbi:MAG: cation diffusion facilitator family transporter [Gammaproteobacteria bacterium]|jgi:cation diffusion facilitator family transporter
MGSCCEDKTCELESLRINQSRVLKWVLFINAAMFCIEYTAGILAHSTALLADSLDMLGDALVYGFSLYVLNRSEKWLAVSALFKGMIMLAFGLFVLTEAGYKIIHPVLPTAELIGGIGVLALAANVLCLKLLWSHKSDDINMRSVWLCSRNDVVANCGVIIAAIAVWLLQTRWPDIIIGLAIATLFLRSAWSVLAEAITEIRQ